MSSQRTDFKDINIKTFIRDVLPHLSKPLYQRAMYWLLTKDSCKPKIPNCRDFVDFILLHNAAVQRIHMAIVGEERSLMDGNNRINAIMLCLKYPYILFPEYYKELFQTIDNMFPSDKDDDTFNNNNTLKEFFKETADYSKIRGWSDLRNGFGKHIYQTIIRQNVKGDAIYEFNDVICNLKWKWGKSKIDPNEPINLLEDVRLSFVEYHNYTVEQQVKTFEDTNRYDSTMSKRDAISATLCYVNADMNDEFKKQLCVHACKYLRNKCSDIERKIGIINEKREINDLKAFDYLVALNDLCSERYGLFDSYIEFCKSKKGGGNNKNIMPIIFDLFNFIYNENFTNVVGCEINSSLFTFDNNNAFNNIFVNACALFSDTLNIMYPATIEKEVFGKNWNTGKKIEKTRLLILLTSIIKDQTRGVCDEDIQKSLKTVLFYHTFIKELKKTCDDEGKIQKYQNNDMLGDKDIKGNIKTILPNVKSIVTESEKIDRQLFGELLCDINVLHIKPTQLSKKSRKKLSWFLKTMMVSLYSRKMPLMYLKPGTMYEREHIIPFSTICDLPTEIDLNRLGNIVPILKGMNKNRDNKHIRIYYEKNKNFIKHLHPLIYSIDEYDRTVEYVKVKKKDKPKFISDDAIKSYKRKCLKNELCYINNFLDGLF